ncbi:MAG: hypothetical protein JST31_15190 [Actinobacteria bacterium]|nr:hypothetical protein [Actinomycetota bacterium]
MSVAPSSRPAAGAPAAVERLELIEVSQERGGGVRGHFRALAGGGRRLAITGWVLGGEVAATAVVVVADDTDVGRAPVAGERPDVGEKYPEEPAAASCGFRLELEAAGSGESQLELFALLEDETREPLGRIRCRSLS